MYKWSHFMFTSQNTVNIIPINMISWHTKPQMDHKIWKYAIAIHYLHSAANCKTWQFEKYWNARWIHLLGQDKCNSGMLFILDGHLPSVSVCVYVCVFECVCVGLCLLRSEVNFVLHNVLILINCSLQVHIYSRKISFINTCYIFIM